jgi:hypothetical protein
MRNRLVGSAVGTLVGLSLTSIVNDHLGLSASAAFAVCGAAGLVVGCLGSLLFDVFFGHFDRHPFEPRQDL